MRGDGDAAAAVIINSLYVAFVWNFSGADERWSEAHVVPALPS